MDRDIYWFTTSPGLKPVDPGKHEYNFQASMKPWPGYFLNGYVTHLYARPWAGTPEPEMWIAHFSRSIYNGEKELPSESIWSGRNFPTAKDAAKALEMAMNFHVTDPENIAFGKANAEKCRPFTR